jgi:multiple sugar transport system substrate-binding protein
MSTSDEVPYCALTFGYTNYARDGFRPRLVRFTAAPSHDGGPLPAVLGGTGIAVSARCAHPGEAVAYAAHVAGAEVQRSLYVTAGGQPAHAAAWNDATANEICHGFFTDTLPTVGSAWLRPRYDGFLGVQDRGGEIVHEHLFDGLSADDALDRLDALHRAARRAARA